MPEYVTREEYESRQDELRGMMHDLTEKVSNLTDFQTGMKAQVETVITLAKAGVGLLSLFTALYAFGLHIP